MFVELIIFLLTSLVVYFLYTYKKIHYFFERNGVKYVPGVPVFGNTLNSMLLKKHIIEDLEAVYNAFPDERYVGYIEGTTPILLIRDPEIIRDITVKGFEHFVDHKEFFPEQVDSLFGSNVLNMKGQKWHDMRTTLSPAFTSSKMRIMMPLMMDISKNVVDYIKGHLSEDIFVDDLMRRYTTDVIATTAFGIQVNSLVDKENEFYKAGQQLFNFTLKQQATLLFFMQFPNLAKKLKLSIFTEKTTRFFNEIVSSTIEYRLKNNVERPDMLQLLIEASKGTLRNNNESKEKDIGFATTEEILKPQDIARKWTQAEIASQVFIFFAAGFETSVAGLTLCLHELALNPDVQDKLYEEIKLFKEARGNLAYDNIGELKYLDCVLNETERKWAAAIILDRICTKPYELPPPRDGGKPFKVTPGFLVYNPVNAIHMDPQYYPEPQKFYPERFSDENKRFIRPFTYMPFGSGPRNCIGSRFALLELKVLLYFLVLNFKIVKCEKTVENIKLRPKDFNIKVLGGTWVRFQARE